MTIDRNKVIEGLECCTATGVESDCKNCPYTDDAGSCTSLYPMLYDALALLMEYEAVISRYHRADAFLAAHGWRWDNETL